METKCTGPNRKRNVATAYRMIRMKVECAELRASVMGRWKASIALVLCTRRRKNVNCERLCKTEDDWVAASPRCDLVQEWDHPACISPLHPYLSLCGDAFGALFWGCFQNPMPRILP